MRVVVFTNKMSGEVEYFSTLKPFFEKYPKHRNHYENIVKYLTRKKQPFENDVFKLERVEVIREINCS